MSYSLPIHQDEQNQKLIFYANVENPMHNVFSFLHPLLNSDKLSSMKMFEDYHTMEMLSRVVGNQEHIVWWEAKRGTILYTWRYGLQCMVYKFLLKLYKLAITIQSKWLQIIVQENLCLILLCIHLMTYNHYSVPLTQQRHLCLP